MTIKMNGKVHSPNGTETNPPDDEAPWERDDADAQDETPPGQRARVHVMINDDEIEFDDAIPKPGPDVYIKRLKGKEELHCMILADRVKGVWYHWLNGRSAPHYRDPSVCDGCVKKKQKKWKGYLHCFCVEMKQEIFLELTPTAAASLCHQLACAHGFRGFQIRVVRTKGDNGRLLIFQTGVRQDAARLPEEKNPMASIVKLWEIAEEKAYPWVGDGKDKGTADSA